MLEVRGSIPLGSTSFCVDAAAIALPDRRVTGCAACTHTAFRDVHWLNGRSLLGLVADLDGRQLRSSREPVLRVLAA